MTDVFLNKTEKANRTLQTEIPSAKIGKKPNVVFLLIDTFNLNSFLGKGSAKIPFLNSLKKQSVVFTQAISTSCNTYTSTASIFTGTYRPKHGLTTHVQNVLGSNLKTLAESFKEAGYYTIAEMERSVIKELGLCRGFDEYNIRQNNETIYTNWGKNITKRLKEKSSKEPFFLFLHLCELHRPRLMTKEFNKKKFGKIAYERSLSCLDFYLAKMFENVKEDTVIVLVADHGEMIPKNKADEYLNHALIGYYMVLRRLGLSRKFCERESHGTNLREDVIRIPLLLKGTMFPKGKVISKTVSQVDIPVTIADCLGLKMGKDLDGKSLMPLIQEKEFAEKPVFIEERGVKLPLKQDWVEGIRTGKWKYVHGVFNKKMPEELYDLEHDPKEKTNLACKNTDKVREMRTMLATLKRKIAPKENNKQALSSEDHKSVEKELRRMGYM